MTEPRGSHRSAALTVVCASVFLSTLDTAIVNLAMPILADDFGATVADVLWVSLTFLVVVVGLALPMGRLGDLHGRKRIFTTGWTVYTTGLVIAALAPTLVTLLTARVVQACGAAMISANGPAIITAATPANRRGRALGILAATVGAGQAAGPIVGGILMDTAGWRSVFWVRVPLAIGLVVVIRRFLPDSGRTSTDRGVDLVGSILVVVTVGAFVLSINRAAVWGPTSVPTVLLAATSVAAATAFVHVERASKSPVLDLTLFTSRAFTLAVLTAVLHHIGRAGVVVLMPFFLIEARGASLLETSSIMVTIPITLIAVAPLSGALADRIGPRALTTVAQAILLIALLLIATVSVTTSVAGIVLRLVLVGCGAGLFGSPNTSAIMGSVPPDRLGTASASASTARQMGQSIGIALAGALFAAGAAGWASSGPPGEGAASGSTADATTAGLHLAMIAAATAIVCALVTSGARGGHDRPIPGDEAPPERATSDDRGWHVGGRPGAVERRDRVRPALTSDERSTSNER